MSRGYQSSSLELNRTGKREACDSAFFPGADPVCHCFGKWKKVDCFFTFFKFIDFFLCFLVQLHPPRRLCYRTRYGRKCGSCTVTVTRYGLGTAAWNTRFADRIGLLTHFDLLDLHLGVRSAADALGFLISGPKSGTRGHFGVERHHRSSGRPLGSSHADGDANVFLCGWPADGFRVSRPQLGRSRQDDVGRWSDDAEDGGHW